ncbi:hypothetical protein [Micrococcus luteus]|uniref:hypothetical protein n=1 Tax=Micrococcus luteus TaxID=1270 RepID=UPI0011AA5805|nr:hypothetical protein [Micrococcus luteus]
MGLGHEAAEHDLGPVAARHGTVRRTLGGLSLKEDAATVAGFRVTGHCHHENENARDKIR